MTHEERAEQIIRDVHQELPDAWLGGRQRYVLVAAIAAALEQAAQEAVTQEFRVTEINKIDTPASVVKEIMTTEIDTTQAALKEGHDVLRRL